MSDLAVIDTNLLLLLVVGSASRRYIQMHDRLRGDYNSDDLDLLNEVIGRFDEIVLLPHVLAELSSFARMIREPARSAVRTRLKRLIETTF